MTRATASLWKMSLYEDGSSKKYRSASLEAATATASLCSSPPLIWPVLRPSAASRPSWETAFEAPPAPPYFSSSSFPVPSNARATS